MEEHVNPPSASPLGRKADLVTALGHELRDEPDLGPRELELDLVDGVDVLDHDVGRLGAIEADLFSSSVP